MQTANPIPGLVVAGLLLAVSGCTSDAIDPTGAQPSFAGAVSKQVPFKGRVAGTTAVPTAPDIPVVCEAPASRVDFTAAGNLTHLGQSEVRGAACNTVTGVEFPTAHVSVSDGQTIIEAANGDLLFGDYSGALAVNLNCSADNEIDFALTIMGGTGRFEGAGGVASVTGTQVPDDCPADSDPAPLSFELITDGVISSVGSLK